MTSTARVLLIDSDAERSTTLAGQLSQNGYDSLIDGGGDDSCALIRRDRPDAILLAASLDGAPGIDLARSLRREQAATGIPIILMGETADAGLSESDYAAAVDDFLHLPCNDAELVSHLKTVLRLKTMRDELVSRRNTMRRYGVNCDVKGIDNIDTSNPEILLVGAQDDPLLAAAALALRDKARVTRADTPGEAVEQLTCAPAELAIFSSHGAVDACLTACRDIRHNSRLYHLPVLLIAEPEEFEDSAVPYLAGVNDVLSPPLSGRTLRARVTAQIKQERLRTQMGAVYRDALRQVSNDALTGLYSHGFLHEHLKRLIDDALTRDKPLSVGYFELADMDRINAAYGYAAGDILLGQMGTVISRLVRGEDLPARFDGRKFCVVMPETPVDEAQTMLRRVAGVLSFTEFALHNIDRPVMVRLNTGSAGLRPGDSAAGLIARARNLSSDERALN